MIISYSHFQLVQNVRTSEITSDVFQTRSATSKCVPIYLLYKLQRAEHVFITSGK